MRDTSEYYIDGDRWISVTEVIDIACLNNLGRIPSSVLEKKKEIGNEVHWSTEMMDLKMIGINEVDPLVRGYLEGFLKFQEEHTYEPGKIEHVVVNRPYRYVGTLDRDCVIDGDLTVCDFKARQKVTAEVGVQLAGYTLALGDGARRRAALNLKPDGTYDLIYFPDGNDFHDFTAARRIAEFRIKNCGVKLDA